jgi:hypothetical protein
MINIDLFINVNKDLEKVTTTFSGEKRPEKIIIDIFFVSCPKPLLICF